MLCKGFQLGKAVFHLLSGLVQLMNLFHDIRLSGGSSALGQRADQCLDAAFVFGQLFLQSQQFCIVSLPIAADGFLCLNQEVGKEASVFGQLFDFRDHLCIQRIAVVVLHLAAGTPAPLLG